MRRWVLSAAVVTPALLLGAVACVDLFHGTDVPTVCDTDASAPGCGDAGPVAEGGTTELCSADAGIAQVRAAHACSWLAACESPIGHDTTGACMVDAILAYDCTANPNRKPKLAAKAFWACLDKATTCDAVRACSLPSGRKTCNGAGFIGCYPYALNVNSRVQCLVNGAAPSGENCVIRGQTCDAVDPDAGNNGALCLGAKRRSCTTSGCSGSNLAACDDAGLDHGTDCALFGEGSCITTGAQPACKPEGASACAGTTAITCTGGGLAQGCASGFLESIDCTAISGAAPGNCTSIADAPPGTPVSAACQRGSGCSVDTCSAGSLVACVAGRAVTVDCAGQGLKPCNDVQTLEGTRAACTAP